MTKRIKTLVRVVAFLLVFGCVFISLENVVVPKRDWPVSERRMTKAYRSYYQEKKNSLDYICIGSSFVFSGISPMEIYRQNGMKGYVLAAPGQRAAVGYHMLKAAMATQKPRVVMADIGSLFKPIEANLNTAAWQGSIDSLPLLHFADRVSMAYELTKVRGEQFGNEYIKRTLLPLLYYHTNYKLNAYDFLDLHEEQVYHRKGYVAKSKIKPSVSGSNDAQAKADGDEDEEEEGDASGDEMMDAVEFNKAYYRKIRDLCRANECDLVFIKVPVNAGERYASNWTKEKHALAQSVADELDAPFLDLNYEDTGLDWTTDTPDKGRHLNLNGATKISRFLAGWLSDHFSFSTQADERLTAQWDYQLDLYDWEMQFYKLQLQQDIIEYLRQVRAGNNTLIVSISGGAGDYWTDEMQTALAEATGTEFDLTRNRKKAYAAISENGSLIVEKTGKKECVLQYRLDDAVDCELKSGRGKNGGAIVVEGNDLSTRNKGIFFAVYNNDLHCIVDCACFDTQKEGLPGSHTNRSYSNEWHIRLMEYCHEALKKM